MQLPELDWGGGFFAVSDDVSQFVKIDYHQIVTFELVFIEDEHNDLRSLAIASSYS